MATAIREPQTFVEMVPILLEDRFPWLGKAAPAQGLETIAQLSDLHHTLQNARRAAQRGNKRTETLIAYEPRGQRAR